MYGTYFCTCSGRIEGSEARGNTTIVKGYIPLAEIVWLCYSFYVLQLQGRGTFSMTL